MALPPSMGASSKEIRRRLGAGRAGRAVALAWEGGWLCCAAATTNSERKVVRCRDGETERAAATASAAMVREGIWEREVKFGRRASGG